MSMKKHLMSNEDKSLLYSQMKRLVENDWLYNFESPQYSGGVPSSVYDEQSAILTLAGKYARYLKVDCGVWDYFMRGSYAMLYNYGNKLKRERKLSREEVLVIMEIIATFGYKLVEEVGDTLNLPKYELRDLGNIKLNIAYQQDYKSI